ncbi:MAG: GNAT family N-acetyltransferase [Rhodocyclales bacterium]|nr:GNAT family N-acetyltransferase [Rhodocyclales bacterium]
MAEYPEHLIRRHRLFDGTEITIRPIRAQDAPLEQDFVRGLSEEARYYRFMEQMRELSPQELRHLTEVDYDTHMALIGTVERDGREIEIGVARYVANPDGERCEFAIAVADAWQGTGVAGILMAELMDAARARGLKTMEGMVLTSNHRMLKFARQLGFTAHREPGDPETVYVVRAL